MRKLALPLTAVVLAIAAVSIFAAPRTTARAAGNQDWVPFTATYSESVTNPGQPKRNLVWSEQRSSDGTDLSIETEGGRIVGGKLWKGSGQLYSLDFNDERAIYKQDSLRQHLIPRGTANGSMTIANVGCAVYPVEVSNGTGSLCIDVARDILVREEIHMKTSLGPMEYVRELKSIDYSKPSTGETVGFPSGFKVLSPSTPAK